MNLKRLFALVKGELSRLNKYGVTSISVLIAIIWGVILYFVEGDAFAVMLPFVLLLDATVMSIMYIGSVMFFEKTESTISSLLVTPSTSNELVLSKVLANTVHNILSSALIIIAFVIFKDVELNYILIIIGILSSTAFFTIAGLYLAYFQKNFTGMLVNIMVISFVLLVPTALYELGVLTGEIWEYILLINPMQSAAELINGGFVGYEFSWVYYLGLVYIIIGSYVIYKLLVIPKFHDYAIKQSGV